MQDWKDGIRLHDIMLEIIDDIDKAQNTYQQESIPICTSFTQGVVDIQHVCYLYFQERVGDHIALFVDVGIS